MIDPPSAAELVAAVREFLEQRAMPELQGRTAFHARVAVNALAIVERQLELAPAAEVAERERLSALLGEEGELEVLTRELCRRLGSGEVGVDSPGLIEHLRATTLEKLAVDQPRYSGYRRALERED